MAILIGYQIGRGNTTRKLVRSRRDYKKWTAGMDKRHGEDGWSLIWMETATVPKMRKMGLLRRK